jgi:Skp family chaperone for outer membrane proteins
MRKIIIAIVAIFTFGAFNANAQTPVFAHVESEIVLDSIQSYKDILKERESIQKHYQTVSETIYKQMQKIESEAAALGDLITQMEYEIAQDDLNNKQNQLAGVEQKAQKDLAVLDQRLMKLMEVYREAVGIVAEKEGITYVLDVQQQLLYAGPKGKNITNQVLVQMIKMDNENPTHRFDGK